MARIGGTSTDALKLLGGVGGSGGGSSATASTYVNASGSVTFTAPTSGRVVVSASVQVYNIVSPNTGTGDLYASASLAGASTVAADDSRSAAFYLTLFNNGSNTQPNQEGGFGRFVISGLTPGGTYTLTPAFRGAGSDSLRRWSYVVEG